MPKLEHQAVIHGGEREGWWWFCVGCGCPACTPPVGRHTLGDDEDCALMVCNPTGLFFNNCEHDEDDKRGGTWHWPERVED